MKHSLILLFYLLFASCESKYSRNTEFFKDTKAYELAKAVERGDTMEIEKLVRKDSTLLNISSPVTGSNVLVLAIYTESFDSFKKLLELGADPNYINPYTKYSVLMEAIRPFGTQFEWRKEHQYAKLLLEHGADPNYAVEEDFVNEKGHHILASSPLIKASSWDLEMVKILIKYGANPYKRLKEDLSTPFSHAVSGGHIDIINYYIDSLHVDVHQPMSVVITKPDNKKVIYYIQDYINKFMSYKEGSEGDKKKKRLIKKLKDMGVDFENYDYKLK